MYPNLGHFIFPITSYGVCLSLAFFAGISTGVLVGRRLDFSFEQVIDLSLWFLVSAIAGARILYIFLFPSQFPGIIDMISLTSGGLVFFGGFIATVIALIVWAKLNKKSLRDMGDFVAAPLATGHAIGRIGCFLNGCCYGKSTSFLMGMVFPNLADGIKRHPTQLYEAVFLFVLFLISLVLLNLRKKSVIPRGSVWGIYVLYYSIFRFSIEYLRDDNRGDFFFGGQYSVSQVISIGGIIFSILWLYICFNRKRTELNETKI
ncbi:MAG: prolipoprotein diacylglyceryl transferase [Candidatus Riflebacteria bacterium]|nr:prolipoprotein diacylglyceryl transferase [Candidatus Riflebacteria bacterium]